MTDFERKLSELGADGLFAAGIEIVQVNVGLVCNQSCRHCHLDCGPTRPERMEWPAMEGVLAAAERVRPSLVDITGGAPEMNPHFRRFVTQLRAVEHAVQVRTNLTVFHERGMDDLPEFYHECGVRLVASLPCYLEENVAAQRGPGVYEKSIESIRRLNALGYGRDPARQLNLVYNPGGPSLPPEQSNLAQAYRRELHRRFGIVFSDLLTITNMPIGRFLRDLREQGRDEAYLDLLRESFNRQTLDGLMCRHQLSIGWDGTLYDCDFNLSLGLPVDHGAPNHISRLDPPVLKKRRIVTGIHCFGCTAGAGSSCRGSLV